MSGTERGSIGCMGCKPLAVSSDAGIASGLLALALAFLPTSAHGWDMKTHLWIAKQVLDDALADGKVSIDINDDGVFETIKVPDSTMTALRMYPSAFYAGNLGPDAFPDLVGGQMTTHPGVPGGWQTDDWLTWVLQSAHSWDQEAFARGYIAHAASDIFGHTYTNLYAGEIFDLSDRTQDKLEPELRHVAVERYISRRLPSSIPPGLIVGADPEWLRDTLIMAPEAKGQYAKVAATAYLARIQRLVARLDEALDLFDDLNADIDAGLAKVKGKIDDLKNLQFELCSPRVCVWGHCTPRVCWTVSLWPAYCFLDPASCAIVEILEHIGLPLVEELADQALKSVQLPIRLWRDQVREAMKQYIEMSRHVAARIAGQEAGDPRLPIAEWICQYLPAFIPVPDLQIRLPDSLRGLTPCSITVTALDKVQQLYNGLGTLEDLIDNRLDQLGWLGEVLQWVFLLPLKLDALSRQLKEVITDEFLDLAQDLVDRFWGEGNALYDMIGFLEGGGTAADAAAALTDLFSADSSNEGLLIINDIVARMDADMHVSGGVLNPATFYPLRNAIVLCKLSLLGPAELNGIVKAAGIGSTIYGPMLYSATPSFSILKRAVRSIDGNHQWQENGIPYPRQAGFPDAEVHSYGYGYSHTTGFRLWQDCDVRSKVFLKIFKGPLAPAMEDAAANGFTDLLPAGDRNHASPAEPFPDADAAPPKALLGTVTLPRASSKTDFESAIVELQASRCDDPGKFLRYGYRWRFQETVDLQGRLLLDDGIVQEFDCDPNTEFGSGRISAQVILATRILLDQATGYRLGTLVKKTSLGGGSYILAVAVDRKGKDMKYGLLWHNNIICDPTAARTHLIKSKGPFWVGCDILGRDGGTIFTTEILVQGGLQLTVQDFTNAEWDVVATTFRQKFGADFCAASVPPARIVDQDLEEEVQPDDRPPLVHAQALLVVEAQGIAGQAVPLLFPVAQDDQDTAPQVAGDAPQVFPVGTTIVTWTATDASGNRTTISQEVRVVDTTPPAFTGPLPALRYTAKGEGLTAVTLPKPAATDPGGGPVQVAMAPARTAFPVGTTAVHWMATDGAGNSALADQQVIVERLPGDIDLDSDVDMEDVRAIAISIGEPVIIPVIGLRDFDGNGTIGDSDRAVLDLIRQNSRDPRDLDGDGKITSGDVALAVGRCTVAGCVLPSSSFKRGDVNQDGLFDLSDAIVTLNFLFTGGPEPRCLKSTDINDSGNVDISDGIALLGHLFLLGAPEPKAPYEACGLDPTPDPMSCLLYPPCE